MIITEINQNFAERYEMESFAQELNYVVKSNSFFAVYVLEAYH